jgi:GH18 family chitinase
MKKCTLPLLISCLLGGVSQAQAIPFCKTQSTSPLIIAYLGADSSWSLKNTDLNKLQEQLDKVSIVNYSFVRLSKDKDGNTIPSMSAQDVENIKLLHQLKPDLPIMFAVGGWGEREGFTDFLGDKNKRAVFISAVRQLLERHNLDGIDVDWENELLATQSEIVGVAKLLKELHSTLGQEGYCITNAVPATPSYWTQYPHAQLWKDAVNWTTIMAYDHYGTFGPKTELGAALYETERTPDERYPYPTTSGNSAVQHYYQEGLAAQQIILGIPFYCHSYYIDNAQINASQTAPGLHVPVLDPNISSQIDFQTAYSTYGEQLFAYSVPTDSLVTFYGLIPLPETHTSRFLSCDSPQTIADKIKYVQGNNPLASAAQKSIPLGGVSFWSLQQDLPVSHSASLLNAIYSNLK